MFNRLEIKYFDNIDKILTIENNDLLSSERTSEDLLVLQFKSGGSKKIRNFEEYYIDGLPLSKRLDDFYKDEQPITKNWVGELGVGLDSLYETFVAKQFLKEQIEEDDIWNYFKKISTKPFVKSNFEYQFEVLKEAFSSDETIFYACQECLDYGCGAITGRIEAKATSFVWLFRNEGKELRFEFDSTEYQQLFKQY